MTNDKFIKKQKKRVIKAINKINSIITKQNFKKTKKEYAINFENSITGNLIEVIVRKDFEAVEYACYPHLMYIFDYNEFDKDKILYEVQKAIEIIKVIENIVQKYVNSNDAEIKNQANETPEN